MGDFDGWTRGLYLSAEDWGSDNVFTRFTAKLLLPKVWIRKQSLFSCARILVRNHMYMSDAKCALTVGCCAERS